MKRFKEPMLKEYRNSEFLQYMKDVLELVNIYDVVSLGLVELRDALAISTQVLATAFEQEKQYKHTIVLAGLDEQRNQFFIGIKYLLQGNTYHFDAVKQEAAKRLLFYFLFFLKNG